MKRRIVLLLITVCMLVSLVGCQREKIEFNYFTGKFNPYTVRGIQDLSVTDMVFESLLVTTGENTVATVYDAYSKGLGIADITIKEANDKTICNIKVGKDIYFSDGVQLTAKDVVFSMYAYADIDYSGWSEFGSSLIDGLPEYQYGSSMADEIVITDSQIASELESPSEITQKRIKEQIILPVLSDEYAWISTLYSDPAFKGTEAQIHAEKYTTAPELFAFYYSVDTSYKGVGDTKDEAISTVAAQYGADYKLLGEVYGTDLSDTAKAIAKRTLLEKALEGKEKDVTSISGIRRIDDFTIEVTVNSVVPDDIDAALNIYVGPCHYYGGDGADANWGEGKSNSFDIDFEKIENLNSKPLGCGRYVLKDYTEGKSVIFGANKDYYRQTELDKTVTFFETGDSTKMAISEYLVNFDAVSYVEK